MRLLCFNKVRPHPEEATNGSRECAPDERLRGRLEGWAAYRFVIPGIRMSHALLAETRFSQTAAPTGPTGFAAKTLPSRRSQARAGRRGAAIGGGGRRRGRQRARGRASRRGVARRAVPAFSEPCRLDDGGGRGGAAALPGRI